jgi:hypothetical protein
MSRVRLLALSVACSALTALSASAADWSTVKGQVLFPANKDVPKRDSLNVTQDKDHCLSKGEILDESVLVDPKTRGVKNVVVWLRPDDKDPKSKLGADQIHPDDAKRKGVEHVITQPCCMFTERVTLARVGDKLVVKNPAPVPHNFFWSSGNNGEVNQTIAKMDEYKMPNPLVAEGPPIQYKCTIHGWMTGYVRIFDHPYYAITDAEGKFEIKNAPAGKFRLVYWHENGFKGGAQGRFGEEVEIKGPVTEVKSEFDVSPKKN